MFDFLLSLRLPASIQIAGFGFRSLSGPLDTLTTFSGCPSKLWPIVMSSTRCGYLKARYSMYFRISRKTYELSQFFFYQFSIKSWRTELRKFGGFLLFFQFILPHWSYLLTLFIDLLCYGFSSGEAQEALWSCNKCIPTFFFLLIC